MRKLLAKGRIRVQSVEISIVVWQRFKVYSIVRLMSVSILTQTVMTLILRILEI